MARSRSRLGAFAVIAGLFPVFVACHLITGLDEYDKGQCPGRDCGVSSEAGDGPEIPDGPKNDRDAPGPLVDGQGAKPVSWAGWPMPNFDGGDTTDNLHSYNSDGIKVVDNVTGLTWLIAPPGGNNQKTYEEARKACEAVTTPPGKWRLPSRIELVTLLDLRGPAPRINKTTFPGTSAGVYWTSSEVRCTEALCGKNSPPLKSPPTYWLVNFLQGDLQQLEANTPASVRCVQGK